MKKTINILSTILVTLILIFTILFIAISAMSFISRKPVAVFGYSYGVVETNSMYPMIVPGDFVLIQKQSFSEYNIGDVIAYTSVENVTIIHQIISKVSYGVETKGINNANSDLGKEGFITEDRILGKVVNYGGHEIGGILINNRVTLITISVIIIGAGFIIQLISLVKQLIDKQKVQSEIDIEALKIEIEKELEEQKDKDKNTD